MGLFRLIAFAAVVAIIVVPASSEQQGAERPSSVADGSIKAMQYAATETAMEGHTNYAILDVSRPADP